MNELIHLRELMSRADFQGLERTAREMLARQPESGVIWQWLAVALNAQGQDSVHALKMAVQLLPNDAAAHNNLGNALARAGQLDDAIVSYRRALALKPQFVEARSNLAQALDSRGSAMLTLGRIGDAVLDFRNAVEIDGGLVEAHNNLGNALRLAGQIAPALASYDRALAIAPALAEAHGNRAVVLRLLGRPVEARAACARALEINPRFAAALVVLGESSADCGDFGEAERLFREAIAIDPAMTEAWAGMAGLRTLTHRDADWLRQVQALAATSLAPRKRAVLEFAIGKYFDDVREFGQAFEHFRMANEAAKRCRPPHDRQALSEAVDAIVRDYDKNSIDALRTRSSDSPRPVFIVGMLRSGTTLAEQILAAHPQVMGAGELPFWSGAFAAVRATRAADERHRFCGRLAGDYSRLLRQLSPDAARVVDKMPTNFAFLGLMHGLFPQARIIHLRRNPLDTCLSIYFQNFDTAISYGNDLLDLAHFYEQYQRLMHHWRAILPAGVMLEVRYEDLVVEPESWSRKMVEFIGLPWDPRCLDFHANERRVVTASKWQVRQKISRSAVDRWRNYEQHVGPLRRLINSATDVP